MGTGKIFINYRRDDSRADAGRLFDHLQARYPARVFRDVGSLEPGIEWRDAIDKVLGDSDACIVVIGKNWLTITDASGKRRLDDARDVVRQEVRTALQRGMRVFPILVGGARMPAEEELPEDLQPLARRNALDVTEQDWNEDFQKLVAALERSIGSPKRKSRSRTALLAIGAVVAAVFVAIIVFAFVLGVVEKQKAEPAKVATAAVEPQTPGVAPPLNTGPPLSQTAGSAASEAKPSSPARPARVRPPSSPASTQADVGAAASARNRPATVEPNTAPVIPRRQSATENAQGALAAGRLVQPRTDSAMYWALQARQNNEPGAAEVLQKTRLAFATQLQVLAQEKRFEEALALVNAYAQFVDPSDVSEQQALQQVRAGIQQAQLSLVRIQVLHRHGIDYRTARCEGWLVVQRNGAVSYECDPRFPHDARCDRLAFLQGTFTYREGPEAGQLHLSTPTGNYDFFAAQPTIAQAVQALNLASAARNLR